MNRREFIFSSGAAFLIAGCRTRALFGASDLRFGVVSDIHITTPKSCRMLERALRYFKKRGADAVVIPGDLADWGIRQSLVYLRETWDRVFAGTDVVPLFCTGNHDWEGWWYGDMTMEMHANGYSEDDRLYRNKDASTLAKAWEEVFGEKFEPVRLRSVKGYDFVSSEYSVGPGKLAKWMKGHADRLKGPKPFFFFQHLPIKGTTADSFGWADDGKTKPVLDPFHNCIAFTGHTHRPFLDERQIWQGEFTAIGVPSLSYACPPRDVFHENSHGAPKDGPKPVMPVLPTRRDLRGGQGFFVDVWDDKVVVERIDIEELETDGFAWVIPVPHDSANLPFANGARDDLEPVPQFPKGASLELETRNAFDRSGRWAIVLDCRFPSAETAFGHRVFDYEIRAVPRDGSDPLVKYFYSPAYPKMAKFEPKTQRFWFNVAELPQDREYVVEVRARNCFGRRSEPIVSGVLRGKPGLDKVAKDL